MRVHRLAGIGVIIGATLLAALGFASPAQAVETGCTTKKIHQSYYAYYYDMHVHWCWKIYTSPTSSTSEIYDISGWADAGTTIPSFEVQKEYGPAHSNHSPIGRSERFQGSALAYGGFQSRSCTVLPGTLCTNWEWHKDNARLQPRGKYTWDANIAPSIVGDVAPK